MKGWLAEEVLSRLGGEWLSLKLDPFTNPDWLETRKGHRPMDELLGKLDRKVRGDVAAVHGALQAERPAGVASAEGVPALSAAGVEAVERDSTSSVPRPGRSGRSHYLYWLLCRLEALGLVTFTLPVRARELPPRALGFDALGEHLPLPTRFRVWQHHLASRALDVRLLKGREEASPREREHLALATLFAFGGPCGRGALASATRIQVGDVDLAAGTVWLRDSAGEKILNLTLHPVQLLSLHRYMRGAGLTGPTLQGDAAAFPSVRAKSGQRTFGRWAARELVAADVAAGMVSTHGATAGLKALLAGAHRWALEIYPVYLASLLAGRFSAAVVERGTTAGRRRRRGEDDPENIQPSAEELRLRTALRHAAVEMLQHVDSLSPRGIQYLSRKWDEVIEPPEVLVPPQGRSAAARAWNLFLLTKAFIKMLDEGEAERYSTAERWLYTSYALLDALGGRPAWTMPEGEHEQLLDGFARRDRRLLRLMLGQMERAAGEHGMGPLPLLAPVPNDRGATVRPRAADVAGVRRARHAPSVEQIDKMARLLLDDARRPSGRKNSAAPLDLLLYIDLLALGARKSEAMKVRTSDVVALDGATEGADLIIRGVKTRAALRLMPLDLHPNRGSAERIVAAARGVGEKSRWWTLLTDVGGNLYERRRRQKQEWGRPLFSLSRLDHALKKLGERVGIEALSPHDLRRASITACLLAGMPPELIAKYHGHEDLPTTFEHYVFGLSAVQARDLGLFLLKEENQGWVAITDAVQLLGATKVAVYKRYSPKNQKVRVIESPDASGLVLERSGGPRYVNAVDLAAHIRQRQPRVVMPKR